MVEPDALLRSHLVLTVHKSMSGKIIYIGKRLAKQQKTEDISGKFSLWSET